MNKEDNKILDELSDDVEEIGEDTDTIIRRMDKNIQTELDILKTQKRTFLGIIGLTLLWILDKVIMWIMITGGIE